MDTGEKLRVGFIGAGNNTQLRHLPGFLQIPGVELAAVANRTDASSQRIADAFSIQKVATDWVEIVEDPSIDAICIGTWPYMHCEISCRALELGKHVLTEARMSMNTAEARKMLAAAEAHPNLVAQIVPSPFTLHWDHTIARRIRDGLLGTLREIHVNHVNTLYASEDSPMTWRQDTGLSGVNMLTLGIVHEAVLRWLVQTDIRPTGVSAIGRIFTAKRMHGESNAEVEVGLPDLLYVTAPLSQGGLLSYRLSGVESGPARNEIRIHGSEASLRFDFDEDTLFLSTAGQTAEEPVSEECKGSGWQVESDFVRSIRSGLPVTRTNFKDGLRYMEFTEAAYNSWHEGGKIVDLPG